MHAGSPSVISLLFDGNTTTLVCTSTGGPPTTVTWRRNGAFVDGSIYWQTQIVMDSVTATYENILGADEIRDFTGAFTCEVSNIWGVDQQTLSLVDGTTVIIKYTGIVIIDHLCVVSTPSVTIIAPIGSFYIGLTTLTLTCIISLNSATDIDVRPEDLDITWLRRDTALSRNDSQVTISNIRGSKLEFISNLTLSPLNRMDTIFTCRARVRPLRRTNFITGSEAGLFVKAIMIQCKPQTFKACTLSVLVVLTPHVYVVMPPLMPLLEQSSTNPLVFRLSWDPPHGTGLLESSVAYNISCQSTLRGIDSPPPIITAPGQTNAVIGNLAYGVTYNCSIIAQLSQIVSQPAYISNTTVEIGMCLESTPKFYMNSTTSFYRAQ